MDWKTPFLEPPMKKETFKTPKKEIIKGTCHWGYHFKQKKVIVLVKTNILCYESFK
jgi:hypothetical protein